MRIRPIIACVDYSDFLRLTLPHNLRVLGDALVVTSPADKSTQQLCETHSVRCLPTDCWRRGGARFNKARALDLALDAWELAPDDWALALDADMLLPADLRAHLDGLDPAGLYTVWRRMCREPHDWRSLCRNGRVDRLPLDFAPVLDGKVHAHRPTPNAAGLHGYFQLWNAGSLFQRFGSFPTAAEYDVHFALQWPDRDRHFLHQVEAVHLGEEHRNWNGRITRCWRGETPYPVGLPFQTLERSGAAADAGRRRSTQADLSRCVDALESAAPEDQLVTVEHCLFGLQERGVSKCMHPRVHSAGRNVDTAVCRVCRFAQRRTGQAAPVVVGQPVSSDRNGSTTIDAWAVGLLPSEGGGSAAADTLHSIRAAGWQDCRIHHGERPDIPVESGPSRPAEVMSAFSRWYALLTELVLHSPQADAYLIFLGDVLATEGLRTYLEQQLWPSPLPGVVSLAGGGADGRGVTPGFHRDDGGLNGEGAAALAMPNHVARAVLCDALVLQAAVVQREAGRPSVGGALGDWCRRMSLPCFRHSPSLAGPIGAEVGFPRTSGARLPVARPSASADCPKQLHVRPVWGLCNRLMVVASGLALAELWGSRVVVLLGARCRLSCGFS